MSKLTAKKAQGKLKPGMHNDGAGLYLRVTSTGAKSWILRCRVHGIKRDIGLGGISWVSLAEARKKAAEMRAVARTGGDPLAERDRAKGIPTFKEAAQSVWREQIETTARSEKHKAQWINTLRDYAFPHIGNRRVDVIRSGDILKVLGPIWIEKPETARRVRQRLRTVFDWAVAAEHRRDANPITGIEKALPKQSDKPVHHKALPYLQLPALMDRLAVAGGLGAMAVRFAILTAARPGEVRKAHWDQFDIENAVWNCPAWLMKRKIEHRVPLTPAAIEVLEQVRGLDPDLVFPGQSRGKPLSNMTLGNALKRLGVDATTHGFRSSFKDWCGECTSAPNELSEMCLHHTVGNAVERAYRRSDLFDKRRDLMEQWGRFCMSAGSVGDVVEFPSV